MKNFFLLAILIMASTLTSVDAQRHEIGISLGKANIIGDIGKSDYIEILPMDLDRVPISIGALYRLNFNNRQSLRFNLVYNRVFFDDGKASEDYRYRRWLAGDNTIIEGSAVFEYYFFDINDIKRSGSSPYIFGGVGVYTYNDRSYTIDHKPFIDSEGNPRTPVSPTDFQTQSRYKKSTKADFNIPFGVGYKFKFKYNWLLSLEVGIRYTLQDNLDYSAIKTDKFEINTDPLLDVPVFRDDIYKEVDRRNAQIIGRNQTGNTFKSNDWYLIWGVNLTYTFGRPPCYCY